jgi:DnaJ homolog subfamily A member 2
VSFHSVKREKKREKSTFFFGFFQTHIRRQAEDAQEKFKEISIAYEVLSDDKKRAQYDRYGEDGLKEGGFSAGDPSSLFEAFFGGGGGGGGRGRQRGPQKADDVQFKFAIGLEQVYKGSSHKLNVRRKRICTICKGVGTKSGKKPPTCKTCGGNGVVIATQQVGPGFLQRVQRVCPDCKGGGVKVDKSDVCGHCSGEKVTEQKALVDVYVDKGIETGQTITLFGEADEAPGVDPGDVVVVVQVRPHERFERDGDDLKATVRVPLVEALAGAVIRLESLDGRELRVTVPPGRVLRPGELIVVKNEGLPHYKNSHERGDLLLRVEVDFPHTSPSPADMAKIEAILGGRRPVESVEAVEAAGKEVEECEISEFNADRDRQRREQRDARKQRRQAEEEERRGEQQGGAGGPGVQCAQQ